MMEVDNPGTSAQAPHVMKAAPHSKTGRQILLHPVGLEAFHFPTHLCLTDIIWHAFNQLAIVTICDHCTRVKVGGSKQSADSGFSAFCSVFKMAYKRR